jgi:hypothetical protein
MLTAVYLDPERSLIVSISIDKMKTWNGPGSGDAAKDQAQLPHRHLAKRMASELRNTDEVLVIGPAIRPVQDLRLWLKSQAPSLRIMYLNTEPGLSTSQILRRVRRFYLLHRRRSQMKQNIAVRQSNQSTAPWVKSEVAGRARKDNTENTPRIRFMPRRVKFARTRGRD